MDDVELEIQTYLTNEFISCKPTVVTLIPVVKERTPAGGYRKADGAPRVPQTFRIIETGTEKTPPQVKLQDGTLREVAFWLLGDPGVIVAKDDHWESEDGRQWRVADIVRSNIYEVRAVVVEDGD